MPAPSPQNPCPPARIRLAGRKLAAVSEPDSRLRRAPRGGPGRASGQLAQVRLIRAGAAVVLLLALASCAKFDAALGQQWAVVHFKADTPVATLLKVRTACSHVPNVRAENLPRVRDAANMIYALRYRTSNASDADLAALQVCLQRFPSVAGIDFEDSGDS